MATFDGEQFLNQSGCTCYHCVKCFFDVVAFQSACLHEHHPILFCILFPMLIQIRYILHFSDRYCFKSDLLPTIRQTMSSLPQVRSSLSHLSTFQKDEALVISQTSRAPTAPRQQALAMERYLSCPAVSQICTLTLLSSTDTVLVANYTPMVVFDSKLNSFLVNLEMMLDLPTPESPTRTNFSWKSESSLRLVPINIIQIINKLHGELNWHCQSMIISQIRGRRRGLLRSQLRRRSPFACGGRRGSR